MEPGEEQAGIGFVLAIAQADAGSVLDRKSVV
jgi:hypothetical protein